MLCVYSKAIELYRAHDTKKNWAELFEMNIKIEQGSNFVIDNTRATFSSMLKKLKRSINIQYLVTCNPHNLISPVVTGSVVAIVI